eukprot:c27991_g1_i1 orf=1167-2189(+)
MATTEEITLAEAKGVVPLSTWVLISNFKLSYNLLRRPDGTFNRHLAEFLDRKVSANATPMEGVATMDVIIERMTGVWGRIFWPCPTEQTELHQEMKPVMIYFHGGSFAHSSANSAIYDAMCRRLARMCNIVVILVNFRRSPEHRFPAAYEDGLAGVRWAKSAPGRAFLLPLGGDSENRCFLAGDSSGGNIAHHVAVRAVGEGILLAGTVLLMPMFGGQRRTPAERLLDGKYFVTMNDRDWYWRAFLPEGADRDHPACNPFSVTAPSLVSTKLPPCLVVVGGLDLLQDWQLNYVHCLKQGGKQVQLLFLEQATMGFFLLPNTELFYSLVERLRDFLSLAEF